MTSPIVYWLPLASAVAHFDVTRGELVRAVKRGDLDSKRIFCGDDMAVGLSSAELLKRFKRRAEPLSTGGELVDPELIRRQARQIADVEAQLEAAERVERGLQAYADRLERQLARARKEALTLARALGRAEQLAASADAEPREILQIR